MDHRFVVVSMIDEYNCIDNYNYECSECKLYVLYTGTYMYIRCYNLGGKKQLNAGLICNISCKEVIIKNIIE